MQNYQLVGTSVIEPLVDCDSFSDRIKMHTNSVRARYYGSWNNNVVIQKRPSDRFSDAVNIYRGAQINPMIKKTEATDRSGNMKIPNQSIKIRLLVDKIKLEINIFFIFLFFIQTHFLKINRDVWAWYFFWGRVYF